MRIIGLPVLLLALVFSSPAPDLHAQGQGNKAVAASVQLAEVPASIGTITAKQLQEILTFIAADELEGRDTPSRGLDTAAKFIAFNLARWGFKPAGDNGTFFQRFMLRHGQLDSGQAKPEVNGQVNKAGKVEALPAQNVVALWEGSDPALKDEYVAVGAHYDHEGVRPPSDEGKTDGWTRYRLFLESAGRLGGPDRLWNGADDDGSGTTAVLALAEALSKSPRPKRSVLLVWHAGEEKGMWGSQYFTDNPTVPVKQIVTQLNIDMIGRSKAANDTSAKNERLTGAEEIYVIGSKMMSSELGEISEGVNNNYLKLKFNYKYDDPNDRERLFYRSDHVKYARKGIPIIFYFDGVHEDYHSAGDQVDKIDFVKMEKVTRTVFATLWELANRAARVKVDKPLPAQYSGN